MFQIYGTWALTHLFPCTFLNEEPTQCSVLTFEAGKMPSDRYKEAGVMG